MGVGACGYPRLVPYGKPVSGKGTAQRVSPTGCTKTRDALCRPAALKEVSDARAEVDDGLGYIAARYHGTVVGVEVVRVGVDSKKIG